MILAHCQSIAKCRVTLVSSPPSPAVFWPSKTRIACLSIQTTTSLAQGISSGLMASSGSVVTMALVAPYSYPLRIGANVSHSKLIGKFGNPDKVCNPLLVTSSTHDLIQRFQVVFLYDNCVYNIWVETRGYSDGALEVSWHAATLVAVGSYVTDAWPPDYHSTGLSPSYLVEITVIVSWLLMTRLVS